MNSAESGLLDQSYRRSLLALARQSIEHGLSHGRAFPVDPSSYPADLQKRQAAFVTLHTHGALRGCIGHLDAIQPLVQDVTENAFGAAFRDPRFAPLRPAELPHLAIEISVLSPPVPLRFASEAELLEIIQPGVDGLILTDGSARGTFLPTVWESLPEPREFLRHLKTKAGLSPDHWSETIQIQRYRTDSFAE